MITGIGWASELIGIAEGEDIFPERAAERGVRERIIEKPEDVIVNIPVLVAPLIRVFRLLVFRQIFPWRQVFQ